MNNRIYVEVNLYTTKLLIPSYEEETLLEIKRFYNTVSYGDFTTLQLNHHPNEPIYANHRYHSVFDISQGFLGNALSIDDISVWYVDILFEQIKDYKKVFLLSDFEDKFVFDNQLQSIRSKLISKKSFSNGKKDILIWDLKRLIDQIEYIKMIMHASKSFLDFRVFANDNLIKFDEKFHSLVLSESECNSLINKFALISKSANLQAVSSRQIKAIEHDIRNSEFKNLNYFYQDYNFELSEALKDEIIKYIEGKITDFMASIDRRISKQIELFWIGQNIIVLDLLERTLKSKKLYDHKISLRDKFYFFHNMEEFNKDILRFKDFNDYFNKKRDFSKNDLEVTFEAIHNIFNASRALKDKNKKGISVLKLIEKRIELSEFKIGNKVIHKR